VFSVVVPVFHDAANLPDLQSRLDDVAEKNPEDVFEFTFVDDGSKGDSFSVPKGLSSQDDQVIAVNLMRNSGSNGI